ncbi:hypothetical protein AAG906_014910 [Vitis piasezkii]
MQQLLLVSLRSILPKHVRNAICRLSSFFNALCSKVVDVPTLDELQNEVVVTLCLFEKYFPPSFFEIMVHLTLHLVREVRLCGPIYLRWMYPFERFMKVLKGYVRNHNQPEGCIAECYIVEEGIEFCTEYLSNVEAIGIPSTSKIDQKVRASIFGGHTMKERDDLRATQNSGVSIVATTMQILCFDGVIIEIWDLDYTMFRIPIINCDWVDNKNGIKVDDLGFTLVDFNKMAHKSDPFILASQAKQVFYVQDELDPRWSGIWVENKSYIFLGVLARTMVPIRYNNWRDVPIQAKNNLWDTIEASFTLDSKSRRNCMLTMGKCFQSFKNMLTVKYVIPFKDQPEMATTGYTEIIDRSILWKKAMEKKDDTYDEVVIPMVEKIEFVKESQERQSKFEANILAQLSQMMPSTPQSDVSSSNIKEKQIVLPQVVEQPKHQVDDHVPPVQKTKKECQLALGTKENVVVASTIILECGVNFLVIVDTSYEPNAPLLVPIPNQITTIGEALGYQVLWPAQMDSKKFKKQWNKETQLSYKDENPIDIKNFATLVGLLLKEGKVHAVNITKNVFGEHCKSFLMNGDMDMIISSTEVSSNCLMFYIW